MIWTERWRAIQHLALDHRSSLLGQVTADAAAVEAGSSAIRTPQSAILVQVGLDAQGLDVFPLPPGDPLLGGARAVFGGEFVAYDSSLPPTAIAFSLAHELGHTLLHGGEGRCAEADIDEASAAQLLDAPAAVESYSPRQQRELEANAFAAAFLMPPAELRAAFRAGVDYATLAARYGVSETAMLNTLAATLLVPEVKSRESRVESGEGLEPALSEAKGLRVAGLEDSPQSSITATEHGTRNTDHAVPQHFALDSSQEAAATVAEGPVLIDAGPGTGKTRTLIKRVGYLLRNGVEPRAILALTFSNRAANEMRERLRGAAPEVVEEITVGTFHAFCLQFLQEHPTEARLPRGVTLIDDVQATAWLETRLAEMRLEHYTTLANPAYRLPDILDAISRARDELVDAAQYARLAEQAAQGADPEDEEAREQAARWAEIARVYAAYEQMLESKGALDFGGLLLRTIEVLRREPRLLARLQARYRHVLVDEYQDMNRASAVLLQLLAGDGRGLWVVGDLRQAIYRFRGASPANINQFESDFPGGRRMRLNVNYRSDPALVQVFSGVGAAMPLAGGAAAWEAQRPAHGGPRLWMAEAGDDIAEAQGIAGEIRRRHAAGRPLRDQVVLCRTNGQAALIARVLEALDVPALYLGNLFERAEVRDLLALVALAAEGDGSALLRAVCLTGQTVDRYDCARLIWYAREQETPFPQALALAADAELDSEAVAACTLLAGVIADAGPYRDAGGFLARVLFGAASPLRGLLADASARAAGQVMAMGQLLALARSFGQVRQAAAEANAAPPVDATDAAAAPDTTPLREFLAHVRRLYAAKEGLARAPVGSDDLDAVRILTIHASKGLEFPVVYVPCLAAGRFPFKEMWEPCPPPPGLILGESASDRMLEETCLFFVALTRARDELVLSRAERYGKQKAKPSPFLEMVAPFFGQIPTIQLQWPPAANVGTGGMGSTGDPAMAPAELTLDVEELEAYIHCPRQYEYSRRLRLRESDEGKGYLRFHTVVRSVLDELRNDQQAGALPAEEAVVLERLGTAWETDGPQGHVHEAIYAEAARRVVTATWRRLASAPPAPPWRGEMSLPLGGATVRARLDLAQTGPDGVRLVRTRVGKPRDEDRKALRLALLRAAARETFGPDTPLRVELEYLESGTTVEVPDAGRYERDRLAKLEAAVYGIRAGHFPPAPSESDSCLRCPFWIICPS